MKKKLLIYMFASTLVISCGIKKPEQSESNPVVNHLRDSAISLSLGVDFKNKKQIALNPINGSIILPCTPHRTPVRDGTNIDLKQKYKSRLQSVQTKDTKCNANVVFPKNSQLSKALKISRSIHPSKVIVNGKEKDSETAVILITRYPGSVCNTSQTLGTEAENCITQEQLCAALQAFGFQC